MKKLQRITAILLLSVLFTTLVACADSNRQNPIDFEKKYLLNENDCFVFHSDGTGYREYKYVYTSEFYPEENYTISGKAIFAWRESSNGAVYLFRLSEEHYADHTEGKKIPVIDGPIHFADEFFTYTYYSQYGDTNRQYVKEGSKLEKLLQEAADTAGT